MTQQYMCPVHKVITSIPGKCGKQIKVNKCADCGGEEGKHNPDCKNPSMKEELSNCQLLLVPIKE